MKRALLIFIKLLFRDFYVQFKQLKNFIINYTLIYPALYSFSFGYIIPNTVFNGSTLPSVSLILASSIIYIILILSVTLNITVLLDFEGDRFINYQLTLINPKLLIIEKIVFTSMFSFIFCSPFFFVAKLILKNSFDTKNLVTWKLFTIIYLGCLTCAAYAFLSICVLKNTHSMGTWWRRVNNPMLMLGGSWVPWATIYKFSNLLGYLVLLNPILYITEGARSSILGEHNFIDFNFCVIALIFFSIIFTLASLHFFKKRTDCITI